MHPHKLGIKIFLEPPVEVAPETLIPIFHRWIQNGSVEGMLIDVADYSHVHQGPGIMLVAHEAHYGLDQGGGRPGMLYNRKRPYDEGLGLDEGLMAATKAALRACVQLESEPEFAATLHFDAGRLEIAFLDRLLAANDGTGRERTSDATAAFLDRLWGSKGWRLTAAGEDPRSPLRLLAEASEAPASCAELLARL